MLGDASFPSIPGGGSGGSLCSVTFAGSRLAFRCNGASRLACCRQASRRLSWGGSCGSAWERRYGGGEISGARAVPLPPPPSWSWGSGHGRAAGPLSCAGVMVVGQKANLALFRIDLKIGLDGIAPIRVLGERFLPGFSRVLMGNSTYLVFCSGRRTLPFYSVSLFLAE